MTLEIAGGSVRETGWSSSRRALLSRVLVALAVGLASQLLVTARAALSLRAATAAEL